MTKVQTIHNGAWVDTFQFTEGDPDLSKCVTDLTLAGVAHRVV